MPAPAQRRQLPRRRQLGVEALDSMSTRPTKDGGRDVVHEVGSIWRRDEGVAYHEAGHALVRILLQDVLDEHAERYDRLSPRPIWPGGDDGQLWSRIVVLSPGEQAARRLLHEDDDSTQGWVENVLPMLPLQLLLGGGSLAHGLRVRWAFAAEAEIAVDVAGPVSEWIQLNGPGNLDGLVRAWRSTRQRPWSNPLGFDVQHLLDIELPFAIDLEASIRETHEALVQDRVWRTVSALADRLVVQGEVTWDGVRDLVGDLA